MKIEYIGINANKLHDELIASGIRPLLVETNEIDKTWVTYADKTDMQAVDAVVNAHNPLPKAQEPTETELLQAEISDLKARLAKVEAVPLVKSALQPVIIKDPILTR